MKRERPAILGGDAGHPVLWVPLLHVGAVRLMHLPCSVGDTRLEVCNALCQAVRKMAGDTILVHDPVPCVVSGRFGLRRNVLGSVFELGNDPLFTFAAKSFRPVGEPKARLWWVSLEAWGWLIVLALAAFRVLA